MDVRSDRILRPKSGVAFEMEIGERLRITDLEGKQVVDVAVFNRDNLRERLSTSYSRTRSTAGQDRFGRGDEYVTSDRLQEGDVLFSTTCRPMMTLVKETPRPKGVHKSHNRSCNRFLYESYGYDQDGCLEILGAALEPYGLTLDDIPDTFDVFMDYHHDCSRGGWVIGEPVSEAGDYVEFVAEMACVVALSNCPDDVLTACNGYRCTPVQVQVFDA